MKRVAGNCWGVAVVLVSAWCAGVGWANGPCPMGWDGGFFGPQLQGHGDNNAYALAVWDDGRGPALYVGGGFEGIGNGDQTISAPHIFRWDGRRIESLDAPFQAGPYVLALAIFDDGNGPALYAGGDFAFRANNRLYRGIARWDGRAWSPVGDSPGTGSGAVYALTVFDDGHGPALIACGNFTQMGSVAVACIARWDGHTWGQLGSGISELDHFPDALAVFDDGGGPALYVGGSFASAGGVPANGIARWDGTSWSDVGGGLLEHAYVLALAGFDDGSGPALYAGGLFQSAGGVSARNIARWDGATWAALGAGTDGFVDALQPVDEPTGPVLYCGGGFANADGIASPKLARWSAGAWSAVGGGLPQANSNQYKGVWALAKADLGDGARLWIADEGTEIGPVIHTWDGAHWGALGSGVYPSANAYNAQGVDAYEVYDAGAGPALYAAGRFDTAGAVTAGGLARWNGGGWESPGLTLPSFAQTHIFTLRSFDSGARAELYAGGDFTRIGDINANYIARWNGSRWATLDNGLYISGSPSARAMKVFDDGSGPALYVGGNFSRAGAVATNGIARWNGSAWSDVGGGLTAFGSTVYALEAFNDGSGSALFVAGVFPGAGGISSPGLIRWLDQAWMAANSGLYAINPVTFAVHNDGSGPALYVGGYVQSQGSSTQVLARWDGQGWSGVGPVFESQASGANPGISALASRDDGSGPALYASGYFQGYGPPLARWDGQYWYWLGPPATDVQTGRALYPFDDGHGLALFIGGTFTHLGDTIAQGAGRWRCVPGGRAGDLNCDGVVDFDDINPFVLALSDPAGYAAEFPRCMQINADCNADGRVDFGDINGFVRLLTGE